MQALQRCVNIFPSLRHLANVADWALGTAGGSSALTAAALLGALQRQIAQAKGMVRAHSAAVVRPLSRWWVVAAAPPQSLLASLNPMPCYLFVNPQVTMISGLPILDLILLVAVQRLAQRGKLDVNFEMVRNTAIPNGGLLAVVWRVMPLLCVVRRSSAWAQWALVCAMDRTGKPWFLHLCVISPSFPCCGSTPCLSRSDQTLIAAPCSPTTSSASTPWWAPTWTATAAAPPPRPTTTSCPWACWLSLIPGAHHFRPGSEPVFGMFC